MADLTVLRALLAHARQTGWDHVIYGFADATEHVWRLGDRRVCWYDEGLTVVRPGVRASVWQPVDAAEAARVLAAAGLVPVELTEPRPPQPEPWPNQADQPPARRPDACDQVMMRDLNGPPTGYCGGCGEYVSASHHCDAALVGAR